MAGYTDEHLISKLQEYYAENGKSPVKSNFQYTTSCRKHFGSWNNALKIAGLPVKNLRGMSVKVNCFQCNIEFTRQQSSLSKSGRDFCSQTCSATYNNAQRGSKYSDQTCLYCGKKYDAEWTKKYCSLTCENDFYVEERISNGESISPQPLKKYLLRKRGNTCEVCKMSEWMNKPMPLETDHIDGNSENNQLTNLRLICPNCHAQTDTYKAKNTGKGRAYRRERYAQGKSY